MAVFYPYHKPLKPPFSISSHSHILMNPNPREIAWEDSIESESNLLHDDANLDILDADEQAIPANPRLAHNSCVS